MTVSVKREFKKLFFDTSDLKVCVTRGELDFFTGIRDFTTLFYVILRRKFSEWLESSVESDLGMRFAVRSPDFSMRDFAFFKHCF